MKFVPIDEAVAVEVASFESLAQPRKFRIGQFGHEPSRMCAAACASELRRALDCATYATAAMQHVTQLILCESRGNPCGAGTAGLSVMPENDHLFLGHLFHRPRYATDSVAGL